jgi:hypothetical protein
VSVSSNTSLSNLASSTPGLTISAWIYPRTTGDNSAIILKKGTAHWQFSIDETTSRLLFDVFYTPTNLRQRSANGTITYNTWQHVVMTWDGSTSASNVDFYINGTEPSYGSGLDASGTRPDDSAQSIEIAGTGASQVGGLIDDVRVYNRVLSADEIKRLYKIGR